ncbi:hypothetical protein ABB37_08506 [Leptomonas pyrrhocoris]|uniref:Uncharacterized protein n=1 Tax=Leptomonas pyrrhocoris TaxID=157538 RepID=A0A0M9FSN8_LEPPY|nr:hypothetical protein ABB37_08506 [Leptomonas pyrrhocoris]KPA75187.1 hypothetical protein ABB37_08506 [Leptomonas pyrrhocoris]|eukprot:XP_015653626.1 hypothetical protein ABB37_08506 [Leptomonas pyrrhocoris]
MEVFLPLRSKSKESKQLKLALELSSTTFTSKEYRIIENGSDLVCVCAGSSSFLYRFTGNELIALGTFFFRHTGGGQVLSALIDEEVKDFADGVVAELPELGNSTEIQLSADGVASFVDFIDSTLLVGTDAGYLGAIFVSADRTEIFGKSMRLQSNHTCHWCSSPKSSTCICVSTENISVISVCAENADVVSYRGASGINSIGAVAAYSAGRLTPQVFFIAHVDSYVLNVLRCDSHDAKLKREDYTLLLTDDESRTPGSHVPSNLYVHEWEGVCALAVVYPDAISFSSWYDATLSSTAALKNELTAAFGSALWKRTEEGCRLYVLRSDARCLLYDVVMNFETSTIREVVVSGQVALPSVISCRLGSAESGSFLCWRTGTPLARDTALLQSAVDESNFEAVETRGGRKFSASSTLTDVLLLEVVPIRESYGIVCLFSNGECHLSLYGERGTVCIAHQDHPHDVTSCLAYEAREKVYACVLGFNDGDICVFVDGKVRSWVRVAHCGVVDKLLWLPKMNEADDTLFVSISTEMGTVCFHAGDNAAVSRTMSSPSRPLTSCLLDRDLEYMFLFSDASSNLWHIPTCRLERAFRSHQGALDRHFDNLLEYHWSSATKILKFAFAGGQHYAVNVNVNLLVSVFDAGQQQQLQPSAEYISAISLILRCLGESCSAVVPTTDNFGEALDDVGLLVAPVQTQECVWCAILMLCALLSRTSDAVSAAAILTTIRSLNTKLLKYSTHDAHRQADAVQLFLSRFYTLSRSISASFRYALQMLISKSTVDSMRSLMGTLKARSAVALADQAVENGVPVKSDAQRREKAISALLIVSSVAAQRSDYNIKDDTDLCCYLRDVLAETLRSLLAAFQDDYVFLSKSALLLGLVESYEVARVVNGGEEFQVFVKTLVNEAFNGRNEAIKQASLEALERLVAHDPQEFLSTVILRTFQSQVSYRPYIIVFLSHLVKNFPYEAYCAFGAIAEIFMSGLSDNSARTKDEASILSASVSQLLRLSLESLPNVSLQPSQNHLAIGRHDGSVVVYNVKTATFVSSFKAHKAPVLGVAYSGNIVTLDIATIDESMNEIKIWRSANQASTIASFFGGGNETSFKLVSSVEVPAAGLSVADASLLIKYFHLSWLSPQCLEFSSPWHGKIQVSLP